MEQIKLANGSQYELTVNGIIDEGEDRLMLVILPGIMNFQEIEKDFDNNINTDRLEVLDSLGDLMDVRKGYTVLKSIKKKNDYVVKVSEITDENGNIIQENVKGVAYTLVLSKPELRDHVNSIQETVDALVLSDLEGI